MSTVEGTGPGLQEIERHAVALARAAHPGAGEGSDLARELLDHATEHFEALRDRGLPPAEATAAVIAALGPVQAMRRAARRERARRVAMAASRGPWWLVALALLDTGAAARATLREAPWAFQGMAGVGRAAGITAVALLGYAALFAAGAAALAAWRRRATAPSGLVSRLSAGALMGCSLSGWLGLRPGIAAAAVLEAMPNNLGAELPWGGVAVTCAGSVLLLAAVHRVGEGTRAPG